MMNGIEIKNIELPKDDSRCVSIIRTVLDNLKEKERQKESESRSASSSPYSSQRYINEVYALRQKMFGLYLPYPHPLTKTESRSASVISDTIPNVQGPNKIYELRKVMFGRYSR